MVAKKRTAPQYPHEFLAVAFDRDFAPAMLEHVVKKGNKRVVKFALTQIPTDGLGREIGMIPWGRLLGFASERKNRSIFPVLVDVVPLDKNAPAYVNIVAQYGSARNLERLFKRLDLEELLRLSGRSKSLNPRQQHEAVTSAAKNLSIHALMWLHRRFGDEAVTAAALGSAIVHEREEHIHYIAEVLKKHGAAVLSFDHVNAACKKNNPRPLMMLTQTLGHFAETATWQLFAQKLTGANEKTVAVLGQYIARRVEEDARAVQTQEALRKAGIARAT